MPADRTAIGSTAAVAATPQAIELALEHHRAGRLEVAQALYRSIAEADPAHAGALHGLGLIALQREDYAGALDLIEDALRLDPSNAIFASNLATAYQRLGSPERAREYSECALRLDPTLAAAHNNLGHALGSLGDNAGAQACYRSALELEPSSHQARLNLALSTLMRGDYAAGLPLYEARLDVGSGGGARPLLAKLERVARWHGEALAGKRILVWTEQGLGDTIMMMRYLPLLKEKGASRVAVCCEPELVRLVRHVPCVDEVFSSLDSADWPSRFDLHSPMMSVPLGFGTASDTIPRRTPYLNVPEPLVRTWAETLSALPSPRIGLVWAGGKQSEADADRSIALASFAPLLARRRMSFVALQKGPGASQLVRGRHRIAHWMDACEDLLDTAALICGLDLVISVDTAVAHLAGALGKPLWLLNRRSSEWRWMLERSDSPWYPTVRIFRQRAGGWAPVIDEVGAALDVRFPRPTLAGRVRRFFGG
ncbi:MAG: glycosyl transferase family 9 [Betaproteobacteria bacterium]|nr:glycosyl transferase family 9 [Betaproteobacteria bacterium]